MPRSFLILVMACVLQLGVLARAAEAPALAEDVVLETGVMAIAEELRCLVCQNETIAASHADLAIDLRRQIRGQLKDGRSPQQIRDFMVERYGDFILYRPRFTAKTVLLWVGPFALLALALVVLWRAIRRATREADEGVALSADEAQRAQQLLSLPEGTRRS